MIKLTELYERLFTAFGPQAWWPARTPFEVIVGAVLTQNASWRNVEQAIANLRRRRALTPRAIHRLPRDELAELIRPSGYYNLKAARLKNVVALIVERYGGSPVAPFATHPAPPQH